MEPTGRQYEWASRYVCESYWFQRNGRPHVEQLPVVLRWAQALAEEGLGVPPLGMLADIGGLAVGHVVGQPSAASACDPHRLPLRLLRRYEDYVLGRLWSDGDFERAVAAVGSCHVSRRTASVAFLVHRVCARSGVAGVEINPAILKRLRGQPGTALLTTGWDALDSAAAMPAISDQYRRMISGFGELGRILSPADLFELEHHTAVSGFSQRLALRQTLKLIDRIGARLRSWSPRADTRPGSIATRAAAASHYPTGGLTSLTTRGSMESLLQSQLMFMDTEGYDRPDLFDIKWVRDELLYYSRDESHFLRPRVTYAIVLSTDLVSTRMQYAAAGAQGILLVLASVVLAVRQLLQVMTRVSLRVVIFCERGGIADNTLADEQELLDQLLRDLRSPGGGDTAGGVELYSADRRGIDAACAECSEAGRLRVLQLGSRDSPEISRPADAMQWAVTPEGPIVVGGVSPPAEPAAVEPDVWAAWAAAVVAFLEQPV